MLPYVDGSWFDWSCQVLYKLPLKQFVGIRVLIFFSGYGKVWVCDGGWSLTHSSCTGVLGQAPPVAPSKVAPWELLKVPCYTVIPKKSGCRYQHEIMSKLRWPSVLSEHFGHRLARFPEDGIDAEVKDAKKVHILMSLWGYPFWQYPL